MRRGECLPKNVQGALIKRFGFLRLALTDVEEGQSIKRMGHIGMRRGKHLFSDLQGPQEKGLSPFTQKAPKQIACGFKEERSQIQMALLLVDLVVSTNEHVRHQPLIESPS